MTFSTTAKRSTDVSQREDSIRLDSGLGTQGVPNTLFVEIVKKNYPMYLRKCYTYVKCHSIAEDAVQEGILAAHLNLASVKNHDALAAWMYRIIVRKAIDLLHKNRRLILLDDEYVTYNKYGMLDEPLWTTKADDPEEELIKNETLKQVSLAVESLDDIYRIPVLLKDFEEFSIREISDILKISESNAKVRIHRARIKLKSLLHEHYFPEDNMSST